MPWELSSSVPNLTITNGAPSQSRWVNLAVSIGTMAMLLLVGQSMGMCEGLEELTSVNVSNIVATKVRSA